MVVPRVRVRRLVQLVLHVRVWCIVPVVEVARPIRRGHDRCRPHRHVAVVVRRDARWVRVRLVCPVVRGEEVAFWRGHLSRLPGQPALPGVGVVLCSGAHLGRHGATQPGAAAPCPLQGVLLAELVLLLHALLPPLALTGAQGHLLLLLLLEERVLCQPGGGGPLFGDLHDGRSVGSGRHQLGIVLRQVLVGGPPVRLQELRQVFTRLLQLVLVQDHVKQLGRALGQLLRCHHLHVEVPTLRLAPRLYQPLEHLWGGYLDIDHDGRQ
uniref:Putative secreted protein n=1 Tax=Ixodes ricinus TaxID=34613 RepID=A0A6B0V6W3_IXORI